MDSNIWEYVEDHRGEIVYETATGKPIVISVLGAYADGIAHLAPSTPYDNWNGSEWITDEKMQKNAQVKAAEQKKSALLAGAKVPSACGRLNYNSVSSAMRTKLN